VTARDAAPLRGRHAVVTGAGRGIGAAIAGTLADAGADVTLLGRTLETLERQAERLRGSGVRAEARVCDVSQAGIVESVFNEVVRSLGPVHVLVNNAGYSEAAPVAEISLGAWERILSVNLTGTFLCMRQVLPAMIAARDGRIVNIASTAGLEGHAKVAAYSAAKHGVIGLTRTAALETARHGVTVNAVCPGYVEGTDMFQSAIANVARAKGVTDMEARAVLARHSPGGAIVTPARVAAEVLRLCRPDASNITGQAVVVSAESAPEEEGRA